MRKGKNNYLFYVILFFAGLFIFVLERTESERTGIKIDNVKKQIQEETDIHASLKIELSRLESPKHLNEMAKKMKFSLPGKEDIIYLQEVQKQ